MTLPNATSPLRSSPHGTVKGCRVFAGLASIFARSGELSALVNFAGTRGGLPLGRISGEFTGDKQRDGILPRRAAVVRVVGRQPELPLHVRRCRRLRNALLAAAWDEQHEHVGGGLAVDHNSTLGRVDRKLGRSCRTRPPACPLAVAAPADVC